MKRLSLLAATLLAAGALHAQPPGPRGPEGGGMHRGDRGSGMDMKPIMRDMDKDMMDMHMSGNPDRDFAMMMRRHHQGAVDMSEEYLRHGHDRKLRGMAEKMIRDQKKEIEELSREIEKLPRGQEVRAGS